MTAAARLVALLRGVNVGGHHKLAMADLRTALTAAGCVDVATYIQSGNAALTLPQGRFADPATWLAEIVSHAAGFDVPVVVRTADELERVVAGNPYPVSDGKLVHAAFFPTAAAAAAYADIDVDAFLPEHLTLSGNTVYLSLPSGAGRSPLAAELDRNTRRRHIDPGTSRNWNTVTKLCELARNGGTP